MKLANFNGGLNTRIDPTLIGSNEAVICENVDTTFGVLKSSKNSTVTELSAVTKPVYFVSNNTWEDRPEAEEYLEYQDLLLWTEIDNIPKKYDGISVTQLGITKPRGIPSLTTDEISPPLTYIANNVSSSINIKLVTTNAITTNIAINSATYTYYVLVSRSDRNGNLIDEHYNTITWTGVIDDGMRGYEFTMTITSSNPPELLVSDTTDLTVTVYANANDIVYLTTVNVTAPIINGGTVTQANAPLIINNPLSNISNVVFGVATMASLTSISDPLDATVIPYYPSESVDQDLTATSANFANDSEGDYLNAMAWIDTTGIPTAVLIYIKQGTAYYRLKRQDITEGFSYIQPLDVSEYRIIGITRANPCVITIGVHNYKPNDAIRITNVRGMVELNNNDYIISNVTTTTITIATEEFPASTLTVIDSTSFGTYLSGGVIRVQSIDSTNITTGYTGTYQYIFTYYNSTNDVESSPSNITPTIDVVSGSITLTNIPISDDPQVTHKRIYRIGGSLLNFTQVAEITNATTTHTDIILDADVTGVILDTILNTEAPVGLRYIRHAYGTFFGAVGDRFYFTRDIDNPNYWPATNYIEFPTTITGIGITPTNIVVFTRYKSYSITGSSANTFVRHEMSGDQGCLDHATIVEFRDRLLFVSSDGICTTNGNSVTVLSKDKIGKTTLIPVNAVVHDEVYYIQLSDNTITAMDFRYNPINIKKFSYNTEYLVVALDVLYGKVGVVLHSLFTNIVNSTFRYKTGAITEGVSSELKTYKTVYVRCTGTHIIKISISGTLAVTHNIIDGVTEMPIPADKTLGYDIQYDITGTGIIYELNNRVQGRKDGD